MRMLGEGQVCKMSKIMVFLRYLGCSFYQQYLVFPAGYLYCRLRFRKKDVTYVVVCDHIGDTLFTLGYLRAFRKKEGKKRLAFVTTKNLMSLTALYSKDVDEKAVIPKAMLHAILKGQGTPIGRSMYRHLQHVILVEPANHVTDAFTFIRKFPQVRLIDFIRYGALGLDENSGYTYPEGHKRMTIERNIKKVIFSTKAQVTEEVPQEYFPALAEAVAGLGFEVYTNVTAAGEREIQGTRRFSCGLAELYDKVRAGDICMIGLRSGLLDLVQHAGGAVVALYPKGCGMEHFFEMGQGLPARGRAFQYTVTEDAAEDIKNIMQIFRVLL